MAQLRTAKERWYGNSVAETIAVPSVRLVHYEEAAIYSFECDASLIVRLPQSTETLCLGVFTRIVNDDVGGGGQTITIQDGNTTVLETVAPGEGAIICLKSNFGFGSWLILKYSGAFSGRTPLS